MITGRASRERLRGESGRHSGVRAFSSLLCLD